jgi:hypothetical protein
MAIQMAYSRFNMLQSLHAITRSGRLHYALTDDVERRLPAKPGDGLQATFTKARPSANVPQYLLNPGTSHVCQRLQQQRVVVIE